MGLVQGACVRAAAAAVALTAAATPAQRTIEQKRKTKATTLGFGLTLLLLLIGAAGCRSFLLKSETHTTERGERTHRPLPFPNRYLTLLLFNPYEKKERLLLS